MISKLMLHKHINKKESPIKGLRVTYAKHRWPNLEKAEDKLFLQRKSLIISAMCSVEINLRKDLNIQIEDGKCMLNRREQKDKVGVMAVV